ncbi:hypothetical protein SO802_018952 [Lithocarpus litseifolius]|uniref:Uncharacterized protein n=1 Tax=Lithocarpus litseifolius TaxID=425828 RepID=A0AAW2CRH8_9ROSI
MNIIVFVVIVFLNLPETDPYVVERSAMLGESKDGLLQYGRSDCFGIKVWVLEHCVTIIGRISPRWVMRHNLSFMLLHHLYFDLLSSCDLILNNSIPQNERFAHVPLLLAFHEPEFVFQRLGNSVVVYCLVQQKLEQVSIQPNGGIVPLQDNYRKVFPFFWSTWFTNRLKKNFVESRNFSAEYLLSLNSREKKVEYFE